MSNWLITGGCGFIGSSLIQELVKANPKVNIRVLDNLSVGTKEDLMEICNPRGITLQQVDSGPKGVELLVEDICNEQACLTASIGIDVIVHLAANTGVGPSVEAPRADCVANVMGVFNMLEAARHNKVKKFIFASSGAPIGECEPPIHEELAAHPVSPYGASKLAGEGYCSAYFRTYGVRTIVLRFGNVYGPRSKNKESLIAKFIKKAMEGEVCEIYGEGGQTRDFIYIADLLEAILKSNSSDLGGEIFQIATSKESTVNEVASQLREQLDKRSICMQIKRVGTRLGDVKRNFSDTAKAKKLLGWQSKYQLSNGLEPTIEYFLSNES